MDNFDEELKIKDHRSDEDFEKMLAELNAKIKNKKAGNAGGLADKTAETADEKAVQKAAEKQPEPVTSHRKQAEIEERKLEIEKMRKDEEQKRERDLISNIEKIWSDPQMSEGGRIDMNIKTRQRTEFRVTLPQNPTPKKSADKSSDKKSAPEDVEKTNPLPDAEELARLAKRDAIKRMENLSDEDLTAEPDVEEVIKGELEKEIKPAKKAKKKPSAKAEAKKKSKTEKKIMRAKKRSALTNVAVCTALFAGVGIFLLFCPREKGFIQSENRSLAKKPKLTLSTIVDGSYFEDISTWYTDTIPGRERFKSFSNMFSKAFGIKMNDVKITGDIAPVKKQTLDPKETKKTQKVAINTDFKKDEKTTTKRKKTTEKVKNVPKDLDDGQWIGSVVVSGKGKNVRAMSAFGGLFETGDKYADVINKFKEDLGQRTNVYTMNMPISSAFYMPKNLESDFTSQKDCITNIGNHLNGVSNIDVYDTLNEHKKEYIYSRTDHHWQPLGAYYAAKVFCDTAQVECPDISTYEKCEIKNFVGTMYAYSNYDEELKNNPDTFTYYKPDNSYTVNYYDSSFENKNENASLFFDYAEGVNCYSAILGTDDEIAEIETDCTNGRVLVIFKDSFGNALVPYLTHGFSKIYVCDLRFFKLNAIDFCNDVGCTDLLFAVSLTSAHTEDHINALNNTRIQDPKAEKNLPDVVMPDAAVPEQGQNGQNDENGENTQDNENAGQ